MTPEATQKMEELAEYYATNCGTLDPDKVDQQEIESFIGGYLAGRESLKAELLGASEVFEEQLARFINGHCCTPKNAKVGEHEGSWCECELTEMLTDQHQQSQLKIAALKQDLKMCREIGVEQQRAVNDRQYKEKLKLEQEVEHLRKQSRNNSAFPTAWDYVEHLEEQLQTAEELNSKLIDKLAKKHVFVYQQNRQLESKLQMAVEALEVCPVVTSETLAKIKGE